ncbi:MAG TPA: hypothetical protein ENK59_06425 [Thioploca sp.]|nr:hypothetical protein [Thioploca sp.]
MNLLFAGISIIIAALLITPFAQDMLQKISVNYLISVKLIVVLMAILTAIISLQYETDEDLFRARFLLYQMYFNEDIDKLNKLVSRETENIKKQEYIDVREDVRAELKYLYNDKQYQEVVIQGNPYISFDSDVRKLIEDSKEKLQQEQIKRAIEQVPQLVKDGKYLEAYHLAKPFPIPELQKVTMKAKKHIDKNFKKLKKWYETGKYSRVIKIGAKQINSDCRIKTLLYKSKIAQETRNRNKKIKRTIKKTSSLINYRKYEKAIKLVNESEFSDNSKLQALVKKAKLKLKKSREKKILRKLRNIPSSQIEANLREYANLLELFPDNKKYQQKLDHYKQKLIKLGKNPPLLITEQEYEQWPFTVSKGELECTPPGIVTFKSVDKYYAISELAIVTGNYLQINAILRTDSDLKVIADKGMKLCSK